MISTPASVVLHLTLLGACLFASSGCSSLGRMETPDAGRSLSYKPGEADFDMEAVETVRDGVPGADLYLRIPQSSLIFLKREGYYAAAFEVRVRFIADQDGSSPVDELWGDSARTQSPGGRLQLEEKLIQRRYALVPGAYLAEVSLQDMNTGVTAKREQAIRVFDVGSGCSAFSRFRLEYLTNRGMAPHLPLHIRENVDSLRALLTVYHPSGIRDGAVRATLLKYPTDSVLSIPPYYLTPLTWSLRSRGVDLSKPCTLWTDLRHVSGDEPWTLAFDLTHLERGVHELVVEGVQVPCDRQEGGQVLQQRRYLCVVDRDFPRLTTLDQLIEVLPYIARESEYKEFTSAKTGRIALFEKFWLGLGGNAQNTRNLMSCYYSRAEEANLLFSNHKEGWKTDRGMIYIVFGPPSLIERQISSEAWSYSDEYRFVFERVRRRHGDEPFENCILVRDAVYEIAWTKQVDRWRRGVVY